MTQVSLATLDADAVCNGASTQHTAVYGELLPAFQPPSLLLLCHPPCTAHARTSTDGTPAAYYFAPGSGANSNVWLVYLEGAAYCFDAVSCGDRKATLPYLMSSSSFASQMSQDGIFSTTNSAFATANRVYVKVRSASAFAASLLL